MLVYRIELENGDGCYRPSDDSKAFSSLISQQSTADYYNFHDYRHPCPSEDSGLNVDYKEITRYRHGFSSLGQLRTWFYRDDILIILHNAGYQCSVYKDIEDCSNKPYKVGHSQVLFKREHFQLVEVIKLSTLVR